MPVGLIVDGCVAVVTIDEPRSRNALTGQTARALLDRLAVVAADERIGALVVQGGGGTFCSGGDRKLIAAARSTTPPEDVEEQFNSIYAVFERVATMPVPTIAAIRGAAVGAGANLALAADLRVVADDAVLIAGFVRIGVHPGGGHLLMSHQVAGRQATIAMSALGQQLTGRRLAELGIAWTSVPDAEVDQTAMVLARQVTDPELVRRVIGSYRSETSEPGLTVGAASRREQVDQFWSFRRPHSG